MLTLETKISDITIEEIVQFGFPVLFGMLIVSLIFYGVVKYKQNVENNTQPIREENAKVIDKQQVAPNAIAFEVWVMFETETGRRVRLTCKPNEMYIVGDEGYLRWQGTRLYSFERGKRMEKTSAPKSFEGYSFVCAPQNDIPTWKRIQMEQEAQSKE